ncbi:MAG: tRNA (5-methylaminomethyl-2-thiouridine)(34)-methyltransferase MnmD, partial [Legionellales bacterium]
MSKSFVPIKTADIVWPANLPFSSEYEALYYSSDTGLELSRQVFIEANDLINRWEALSSDTVSTFSIAETGFGTGLNFLHAWYLWEQHAPPTATLSYISCELHPLKSSDLLKALSSWPQLGNLAQELIHQYPVLTPGFHRLSFCRGRVTLTLMLGDVLECYEQLLICGDGTLESSLRTTSIDAWFLDGFTPSKNPRMWVDSLFPVIALLSKEGTTLSTNTAADSVRSNLSLNGFSDLKISESDPKCPVISAIFNPITKLRLRQRHTPWHIGKSSNYSNKKAIIIGAGLAGCFTAHSLAKRGWKITLVDSQNSIGSGASANQQAVLFPRLSAYCSPMTQFMLSAYLYANTRYK